MRVAQGKVEYVAVRAGKDECATPAKLVQNYVICRLDKKLDILLGFIKTHLKSKMIVFFTSCAQVCTLSLPFPSRAIMSVLLISTTMVSVLPSRTITSVFL